MPTRNAPRLTVRFEQQSPVPRPACKGRDARGMKRFPGAPKNMTDDARNAFAVPRFKEPLASPARATQEFARMHIAQIAPLTEAVPPKLYGGTERVIHWLTDELVALGHDVTLFASGDSQTSAKLQSGWP